MKNEIQTKTLIHKIELKKKNIRTGHLVPQLYILGIISVLISCNSNDFNESEKNETSIETVTKKYYPYKYGEVYYVAEKTEVYTYLSDGNISIYTSTDENGIYKKQTYTYTDGLLTKSWYYGIATYKYLYEYDNLKRLSIKEIYDESGLDETIYYEYDNQSYLIKQTEIEADGDTSKTIYFYKNEAGKDTLIFKKSSYSEYILKYTYDYNHNVLTDDFIENGDTSRQYTYTYEYDSLERISLKSKYYSNRTYTYEYKYFENDSIDFIIVSEGIGETIPLENNQRIDYSYEYFEE